MIREHLPGVLKPEEDFEWRGKDSTRLENFSDAVFGFAVTLLVVSLEVPKNFQELLAALRGFIAFAACFAILVSVWRTHCKFFRRYGLQTSHAVFLNSVLLFCLLFYIYPLKFLFVLMFSGAQIEATEVRLLLVIYGAGYAALALVFALLYRHAWQLRDKLQLNAVERLITRHSLLHNLAMLAIAALSILLAITLPAPWVGYAGFTYFAIPLYFAIVDRPFGRRVSELKARERHTSR